MSKPNLETYQEELIPRMQICFDIQKSLNVIDQTNEIKKQKYMIISTLAEKVFDKIQQSFMIKILNK